MCSPITLSSSFPIGQLIGAVSHISIVTIGQKMTAILICESPVQRAWGIISPKISTAVTEIMIAYIGLTTLFKKIGKASIASALHRSKVTNIQWYLSITEKILVALFLAYSLPFASISKASLSIEASPTVSPEQRPPKRVKMTQIEIEIIFSFVVSFFDNANLL